jgi:apolipoprotein N-acyltransferase
LRLIAISFIWLIFEWMKSWVLTGFPWLDIGYTQTPSWLFSWAPIGGIYLVSLMVLISACFLTLSLKYFLSKQAAKALLPLAGLLAVMLASHLVGRAGWSQPIGSPITVGIVQANVPINEKWQAGIRDQIIANYRTLSEQLQAQGKLDLLVWPETALPLYMQQTDADFWNNITPSNTALLTGIMDSPSIGQGTLDESYNAAVLSCDGQTQVYRKRHLVPFGEYLPLRFLFNWVLEYLELPMSDFSSWKGPQSLNCGAIKVGLSICYEDAFAAEYREFVGDATVLVNISEDAWFGDSFAPHQRRQMAQMRAKELSRPMVRSANSGPSLFIDERGALLAATAQFEVATLSRQVQAHTGDTPFKRYGNWIISLSFLIAFGLLGWLRLTCREPLRK